MIAQALLSAWLLTFTLSLDDVVLSAFLSGPGATTMPLVIFSRARLGLNPSVNAVATLIVAVVAIGIVVASLLIARNERRRAADAAAAQRAGDRMSALAPPAWASYLASPPAWRWSAATSASRRRWSPSSRCSCWPGCASASPRSRWRLAAPAAGEAPLLDAREHRLLFLESFFGNFLFSICMLFGVA